MIEKHEPKPMKASEFFFRSTGTLAVVLVAWGLIRWTIPDEAYRWNAFLVLGIGIIVAFALGCIFAIWDN